MDRPPNHEPPAREVHAAALRLLARRAYSRRELEQRLARKGFAAGPIAQELRRLEAAGLLDEEELAHTVRRSELRRGVGRRSVAAALRRRRLGDEAVAAALSSLSPDEERDALAAALKRALQRYPQAASLPGARQKVVRYLLARGFPAADVIAAVRARAGEIDDAEEELEPGDPPDLP